MDKKISALVRTDFIKNRTVQWCTLIGLMVDLIVSHTIYHVLILFSLPYFTSVCLNYLMEKSPVYKQKPRVSEQFRSSSRNKIKIIPR
jgi:hypothetical protein